MQVIRTNFWLDAAATLRESRPHLTSNISGIVTTLPRSGTQWLTAMLGSIYFYTELNGVAEFEASRLPGRFRILNIRNAMALGLQTNSGGGGSQSP